MADETYRSRSYPNTKIHPRPRCAFAFTLLVVLAASLCSQPTVANPHPATSAAPQAVEGTFSPAELKAFAELNPIDTHAHIFVTDPAFTAMLKRLNVNVLDICVAHSIAAANNLSREIREAENFVKSSDGHGALCTTFNPYPIERPEFAQTAIRQINQNFTEGAIAVKIWKNVGMEVKDAHGGYIMPDNPVFAPIYSDIAAHGKTLVAHLAEPDSCWKPLDPASPDYSYYKEHPEWYMYGKPGAPSKAEILRARDHLVEENPNLRVVGAHLGSMESNFDGLGRRFDRYPNFAVDMAARMPYVMMLPRGRAIAFITKYRDRLIYGTDLDYRAGSTSKETMQEWEKYYARDWRFLATRDVVEYMGKKYQGLDLPQPILEKLYHSNALHWFPGILGR
ncbi:MAG TPA: amidohydrolase family protein [Terriglobia bacterium]|nr:amidohydrolase family protein [Terriglobia bacterium]